MPPPHHHHHHFHNPPPGCPLSLHRYAHKFNPVDIFVFYSTYQLLNLLQNTTLVKTLAKKATILVSRTSDAFIPLLYKGFVPDFLVRFIIRIRLRDQLLGLQTSSTQSDMETKMDIIAKLKTMPVAVQTEAANEQHYEVPAQFYNLCLGPRKKYSSGYWPRADTTFEQSEVHMLELYCQRAGLKDGMKVVDLGCGWGSLVLFVAERFPNCEITGISNSHSQREYIMRTAKERGLVRAEERIRIITCNVSDDRGALDVVKDNDLVISVEMFEHMKNYSFLLQKIHSFLKPTGKLFVHIFSHKRYAYHFDEGWLAEHFFTGGTMPSDDLLLYFADHFSCRQHWRVNGMHYSKTSNAWLATLDKSWKAGELKPVLRETYGKGKEVEWYVNWRLFYLSCAELWGYDGGEEWIVSHYLFDRR